MLREIGEALETITAESPLLLLLEDLPMGRSLHGVISSPATGAPPGPPAKTDAHRHLPPVGSGTSWPSLEGPSRRICWFIGCVAEIALALSHRSHRWGKLSLPPTRPAHEPYRRACPALFCNRHSEGNPLFMVGRPLDQHD